MNKEDNRGIVFNCKYCSKELTRIIKLDFEGRAMDLPYMLNALNEKYQMECDCNISDANAYKVEG